MAGRLTEPSAVGPACLACRAGHPNYVQAALERILLERRGVAPRSTNVAVSLRRDEPCSTPRASLWPVDSHDAFAQSGLHRVLQAKDQRLVSTERDGYFGLSRITTEPLTIGSTIFVDLPEHGISADFTVREIRPCPTPMAGDGYLVTTKFIHENAEILDLQIEGFGEPIGTTASHPFWSEDRQQFVAAGELRVGENLILADDTTRRVESITLRPNRETVYNIEVDGEHVFYVGEDGVLVHNECAGLHHLVARYLGSKVPYGHKWLTRLSAAEHTHLHSAMRKWMRKNYPDLMHGRGRGREHMVNTYTLKSRINALREFYRQYRNPRSNKDFLKLFETELIKSAAKGWIE